MGDDHRFKIKELIKRGITKPTLRDEQSMVGPSELGTKCDFCLGVALTRAYPEYRLGLMDSANSFGLKAWQGTAVHEKLERDIPEVSWEGATVVQENKVAVYELDGYGTISGHVDLVWYTGDYLAVVDLKTTDRVKLKGYKLNGVPDSYVFQLNLYGYGIAQSWRDPDDVAISFIPRDSNDVDDVWTCFAPYNAAIAETALDRLEWVWGKVRKGDLMLLAQDTDDCWNCKPRW